MARGPGATGRPRRARNPESAQWSHRECGSAAQPALPRRCRAPVVAAVRRERGRGAATGDAAPRGVAVIGAAAAHSCRFVDGGGAGAPASGRGCRRARRYRSRRCSGRSVAGGSGQCTARAVGLRVCVGSVYRTWHTRELYGPTRCVGGHTGFFGKRAACTSRCDDHGRSRPGRYPGDGRGSNHFGVFPRDGVAHGSGDLKYADCESTDSGR